MKTLFKSVIKDQNSAKFVYGIGCIKREKGKGGEVEVTNQVFTMTGKIIPKAVREIILGFTAKIWPTLVEKDKEGAHALLAETLDKITHESLKSNKGALDFILPSIESFFKKLTLFRKAKFLGNNDIIERVSEHDVKKEKEAIMDEGKLIQKLLSSYEGKLKEFLSDLLLNLIEAGNPDEDEEGYTKIKKFKEYFDIHNDSYVLNEELNPKDNLIVLKKILEGIREIPYNDFDTKDRYELYKPEELDLVIYVKEKFELMLEKSEPEEGNETEN